MLPSSTGSIIPILLAKTDREIVHDLRTAHATGPEYATALDLGRPLRRRRIERLLNAGALQRTGDRYYLDEAGLEAFKARRRRRMLILLLIIPELVILFAWLISRGAQ